MRTVIMSLRILPCLLVGAAVVMVCPSCAPVDSPDEKIASKAEPSAVKVSPVPSPTVLPQGGPSAAAGNNRPLKAHRGRC
jgi:hypothetical protein